MQEASRADGEHAARNSRRSTSDWARAHADDADMYTFQTPVLERIAKDPAPGGTRKFGAGYGNAVASQGPRQRRGR
jgi:hypothetical protein